MVVAKILSGCLPVLEAVVPCARMTGGCRDSCYSGMVGEGY